MEKGAGTVGFIGTGNMARALIRGLLDSGRYDAGQIFVADVQPEAWKAAQEFFGVTACPSNLDLVLKSDIVVLSVKPQNMAHVLEEIAVSVGKNHLIISIAAGIPLNLLAQSLGEDVPAIRVMPNTPALVQQGISALAAGPSVSAKQMGLARDIFEAVGQTVEVREEMMDAVTALSGSGPGYLFRIMECMTEAGENLGLDRDTSLKLVVQTFVGASVLASRASEPLSTLRERVTSPGGTTAAGLAVLEKGGLREVVLEALEAARNRSVELGRGQ